jgi:HemY protein
MKWLLIALISLISAYLLGEYGDRGYVLMRFAGWSFETSFILFCVLGGLTVWASSILLRLIVRLIRWPGLLRHWFGERLYRRRRGNFARGLVKLTEGHWAEAERYLSHIPQHGEHAALAYLGAAWAAHHQAKPELRDQYIARAKAHDDNTALGAVLLETHIALEECRATKDITSQLQNLHKKHPKHPQILKFLAESAAQTNQWRVLQEKLPLLQKQHAADPATVEQLRQQLHLGLLDEAARHGTETALRQQWKALPAQAHDDSLIVAHYAKHLEALDAGDEAAKALCDYLHHALDERCITLLGHINTTKPGTWLARVEQWLTTHPDHAGLLLTASRLAFKHELWGKARSYAEASLALKPTALAYADLARLQEFLGDTNAALVSYRKATDLATPLDG